MDDGQCALCSLIVFAFAVIAESLFYGFGAAIQELNEQDVEKKANEEKDPRAIKLVKILDKPWLYVYAIHIICVAMDMIAGYGMLQYVGTYLDGIINPSQIWPISFLVDLGILLIAGFILLLFGILLPRQSGINHPEKTAYSRVNAMNFLLMLMYPAVYICDFFTRLLVKAGGNDFQDEEDVTEEEIISMVNEGHEQGILEEREAEMINNIFEFDDKKAEDIMTHRTEITALDGTMTLEDAQNAILNSTNSRYPVYSENIDEIIGIVHIKDIMKAYRDEAKRSMPISGIPGLLREAHCIPESRNVSDLFRSMQQKNIYLVIVVDEYGQTAGLITMEDILEEIVGNIRDEYDVNDLDIKKVNADTFILKGSTALDDVSDALELSFDEDEHETINGFMVALLDRIPIDGEKPKVYFKEWQFQALRIENRMIVTIRASRIIQQTDLQDKIQ